jgi:hypothetical protein
MDILPIVFSVILVILTIVLSVVGIQMVLVLMEVRRTLRKANQTIELVEEKINSFTNPLKNLGGALGGIKTGMKFFEALTSWLQDKKTNNNSEDGNNK